MGRVALYIQGSVRRSDVSNGNESNINQGPNPKPTKAEEFSNALLPVAKVEPGYRFSY